MSSKEIAVDLIRRLPDEATLMDIAQEIEFVAGIRRKAALWAVDFYRKDGFRLTSETEKTKLLGIYWTVPPRQIQESVVLASEQWVG